MSAGRRARGSVLLLLPAGMLIVVVLAAICVDTAVVLLGEREAGAVADAAANDAATAALDEAAYRANGRFVLDPDRARRVARAAAHATSSELHDLTVEVVVVSVDGEPAVQVTVNATVDTVFAGALPGGPARFDVTATATALARTG